MTADDLRAMVTSESQPQLWSNWRQLSLATKDWSTIPKQDGVYIVKTDQQIDRLQGQSDVVKIGQGRLFNRIKAYEDPKREVFGSPDTEGWKKRGTARRMRQFWRIEKFPTMISYFSIPDTKDIQLKREEELIAWAYSRVSPKPIHRPLTSSDLEYLLLVAYYQEHSETPPLHMNFS